MIELQSNINDITVIKILDLPFVARHNGGFGCGTTSIIFRVSTRDTDRSGSKILLNVNPYY